MCQQQQPVKLYIIINVVYTSSDNDSLIKLILTFWLMRSVV